MIWYKDIHFNYYCKIVKDFGDGTFYVKYFSTKGLYLMNWGRFKMSHLRKPTLVERAILIYHLSRMNLKKFQEIFGSLGWKK